MYIRKIWIEDVRCFGGGDDRVELDLARPGDHYPGWTVLAGRNGTGKSSLLKAIALAVAGPSAARSLQASFAGWIRAGAERGYMGVELTRGAGDGFRKGGALGPTPFWADLQLTRLEHGPEPDLGPGEAADPKVSLNASRGPWADNPEGWFLAGYGLSRRLSGHSVDAVRLMTGPPRISRVVSLFREDASLVECLLWLREIYLRRLEDKPGAEALEKAVIALLNHGSLLPGGTTIHHIDSEGLWTERDGVILPLAEMSDGYRAVLALVLDLVMQMDRAFGGFAVEISGDSLTVPYEGVVLIDEVDAHLHIEWQKRIGFWLKAHFPSIQFLVTTHSPFICQAADLRGLIRLPSPGSGEKAAHVSDEDFKTIINGGADDAAFTALFGIDHTHSDASEARKQRVAQLEAGVIRGTSTPEDRAELEKLLADLPDTGAAMVERAARKHEVLR